MERRIDVNRGQGTAVDNDFSNMRDRFESEMRRVEDEMHRLREDFEGMFVGTGEIDLVFATFLNGACLCLSCMRRAVKRMWIIS